MRRIAQALDTGPASLYVYVANRDELHELLFDAAIGTIEDRAARPGALARAAQGARPRGWSKMMVEDFPGIAILAMARIPSATTRCA